MANFSPIHQLILICTLLTWQITSSEVRGSNPVSNSVKSKRSILDDALDSNKEDEVEKRYSSFRRDLGKRDLDKRYSSFRRDLGKRSSFMNSDDAFQDDIKRASFNSDLGKRYSPYKSDLGKRVGILGGSEAPEDLLETIKRYGGMAFPADLGKRSSEEDDIDALKEILYNNKRGFRRDLGKRYSGFNSDLGKRSAFRYDLGKRSAFRFDLGKRSAFRYDLGKRQYFRHDLGKRSNFNADLGKRAAFNADLGKRPALEKRSADGTKRQQGD